MRIGKLAGRNGSTPSPLKITGNEIRTIVPSNDASRAPSVVFDRTVHLYSTIRPLSQRGQHYGRSGGSARGPLRPDTGLRGIRIRLRWNVMPRGAAPPG